MDRGTPILIVITDEVGSIPRDEKLLQKREEGKISQEQYKNHLFQSRNNLFINQMNGLTKPEKGWRVIKTVGDSLIISFKPTSLEEELKECIGSLFKVWKHFRRELRVACHLAYLKDILIDEDLVPLRNSLERLKSKTDICLSPILSSIDWDIFGSAMNRAARLAGLPKRGLFIVSQEVMEVINDPNDLKQNIRERTSVGLKLNGCENTVRAYAIPVVKIKGLECLYTYKKPWFVWEIAPFKKNGERSVFAVENKEFQTIKILLARFYQKVKFNNRNKPNIIEHQPEEKIREALLDCESNPFFIDFMFDIEKRFSLYHPSLDRVFEDQDSKIADRGWESTISEEANVFPYYIMFTSAPNESVHKEIRDYFRKFSRNFYFYFQVITLDIYGNIEFFLKQEQPYKQIMNCKQYYLLLFQIRSSYLEFSDDIVGFFKKERLGPLKSLYYGGGYELFVIAFGLIKGESDGFILFGTKNEEDIMGTVKDFLLSETITNLRYGFLFFHKIAPLYLYKLKPRYDLKFPREANVIDLLNIPKIQVNNLKRNEEID